MKLHLLGTGASVSDAHRTVTMLAVEANRPDGSRSTIVVDCGGDVIQRLLACGIDLETIDHLIVTHEHPDHVSGFTLMFQKLWLSGRKRSLPVHGIEAALTQAKRVLDAFDIGGWREKGFPEADWHVFPHKYGAEVISDDTWHVTTAPADHSVPTAALRLEHLPSGSVLAYSCDTSVSNAIVELARGADLLVHEANGSMPGHTSPEEAAGVAVQAEVGRLILVHLPPGLTDGDLAEARERFAATELGEELGAYHLASTHA